MAVPRGVISVIISDVNVFITLQVNLEALYNFMGVMIGSSVVPIILCMFWPRLTGLAMEIGAVLGLLLGVSAWLLSSVIFHKEFNLSKFLQNSSGMNLNPLKLFYTTILIRP